MTDNNDVTADELESLALFHERMSDEHCGMTDSNATEPYRGVERLCKLLDAAGVDYDAGVFGVLWGGYVEGGDSLHEFYACAAASEELVNLTLRHLTPEQAVAATLASVDKGVPQGADGNLDQSQVDWLRFMPDGWDGTPPTLGNGNQHNQPFVGLVRGKHHERTENSDCYCGRCGYPVTDHDSYCRECGGAFHELFIQLNGDKSWHDIALGADDGSRWSELFGTPERAAKTVAGIKCDDGGCEGCSLYGLDCTYDEELMLELLRGKAVKR